MIIAISDRLEDVYQADYLVEGILCPPLHALPGRQPIANRRKINVRLLNLNIQTLLVSRLSITTIEFRVFGIGPAIIETGNIRIQV